MSCGVEKLKLYIARNSKVSPKTNCWVWNKSKNNAGYAQAYNGNKIVRAHRLSYEVFVGKIPHGLCILHSCNNRACTNPEHLFIGKRTPLRGDKSRAAKLNKNKVEEIRKLYADKKYDQYVLAEKYRVSQSSVSNIIRNKIWHI